MSDELISKQVALDALLAKMDEIDDKPEVVLGMAVAMGMIKAMPPALEQEPCDDAVSREAVLDLCDSKDEEYKVRHFREDVECLPSVQPKQTKSCYKMCDKWQRMGRWKPYDGSWYECSECGAVREAVGFFENYCPNCGAKMASPTGSEGSEE